MPRSPRTSRAAAPAVLHRVAAPGVLFGAPGGRYLARRRFVLGYPVAGLQVLVGWGAIGEGDATELAAVLRAQHARIPPHASLVDLRRVVHVDEAAITVLAEVMKQTAKINAQITIRGAVVRPPGVSGMMIAGFWHVVDSGYPTRVFAEPAAALRWLGHPRHRVTADLEVCERLREECARSDLADRLREHLDGGASTTIEDAARWLGVSPRSLQRGLHEDSTSFRAEVGAARTRAAIRLLRDDELSIKAVAVRVGMASTSAFAAWFRRRTGVSPSAWRRRT